MSIVVADSIGGHGMDGMMAWMGRLGNTILVPYLLHIHLPYSGGCKRAFSTKNINYRGGA